MALPVGRNLTIYKGDSYEFTFRLRDRNPDGTPAGYVNLTGCTAKAQIRATEDSSTVIAEFATEIPAQVNEDLGRVNISLSSADTGATSFVNGKWDVQLTWPDGKVKTYLAGSVTVTKEVTRA